MSLNRDATTLGEDAGGGDGWYLCYLQDWLRCSEQLVGGNRKCMWCCLAHQKLWFSYQKISAVIEF